MQVAMTPRFAHPSGAQGQQTKADAPLLVHLDVNKTVIQSDSIQMKGIEDGIREGIAELFWGFASEEDGKMLWEWAGRGPSCFPNVEAPEDESKKLMNYFEYCRKVVQDRTNRKEIIKTFKLVGEDAKVEMDKLLQVTMKKMQLPADVRYTKAAEDAGLRGSTVGIFPTLFHFVAALQRSKRPFAIMFRSFGTDHAKIKLEWNSFCEMRHPVYSKFIEGVGPLDGTRAGIPDRRIQSFHTLYRDAEGPLLILETFTNGPNEKSWDAWAKSKPKPITDTRDGRGYVRNVLQAKAVDGFDAIRDWMKLFTDRQETAAIKDDWAWWQWHGEVAEAGKLLILFGEPGEYEHLFFDDNIEIADTRIVDCRDNKGKAIDSDAALNKICTKVNPVEALLDDGYFLRKLQLCHGEHLDVGASLMEFQRQLAELEDHKGNLAKKVKSLTMQLKTLTDENRRMKLLHRINVRSEGHLREVLSKEFDLEIFGKNGLGSISDLFWELDQGHCWLEQDEQGNLVRSFEMAFIKCIFEAGGGGGNLVLVESHEQSSNGLVQSRNYLPGVRKSLKESTFQSSLDRWLESGLGVGLTDCINNEVIPVFTPEAPSQQTLASQAYPIPCKIQMSEVKFILSNKAQMTHQEVLGKIGLPAGKHFTKVDKDTEIPGTSAVTRFFRWDKVATWEASLAGGVQNQKGQEVDIQQVCDKLFRGHPRQEVYENLLLQMFEVFTAKKLCGGFSGSVVIRVQPFDEIGRPSEACIVKLDAGEAIREEYINSANVFAALPDRAARIIGDAAYAFNKDGDEFGAMRLELAGACWNVPELAQGSANLLSTFKDLLLYESEQVLGGSSGVGDVRPFGNVNSVLAETFGPGGVVASLRKGGSGLHRATGPPLPTTGKNAWFTLKGKESKFNPYTAKEKYPPEPAMRRIYKQFFGEEMPDLKELVVGNIKLRLQELAESTKNSPDLLPLVALAHGDLNAANIMIDALDAVWLIDFATSVELPLFTDLCKFEMACLFEYATIPITPKLLLEFASSERNAWSAFNVGDWLRIKQDIAELLLRHLADLGLNRLSGMTKEQLDKLIEDVVSKSGREPDKQREAMRALKARLCHDESEMACAFSFCKEISNTLLKGDYIFDTLDVKGVPLPDSAGQKGALSLKFFMDIAASIRRFMYNDYMGCLRSHAPNLEGLHACEALSLQMWLPILRESYRLIGYGDVPPQQKIWSIYHCNIVAGRVLRSLEILNACNRNFSSLPLFTSLKNDLANTSSSSSMTRGDFFPQRKGFKEIESRWIYSHKDMFPAPDSRVDRVVHKVHANCPLYSKKAGLFAPIYQVVTSDNVAIPLLFETNPMGEWTLFLNEDLLDDLASFSSEEAPLFDKDVSSGVGVVKVNQNGLPTAVVLSSRLLYVTNTLVKAQWDKIDKARENFEVIGNGFAFSEWSDLFPRPRAGTAEPAAPKKVADHHAHAHAAPRPGSEHLDFLKFLSVPAIARRKATDEGGSFIINLVLGNPALCYPPGTRLCIDTSAVVQQRSLSCEVVVLQLQESGLYRVADALAPFTENERDFGATYGNHVYLTECKYKPGEKITFNRDRNSWADCEVSKPAQAGVQFRTQLTCWIPSMPISSGGLSGPVQAENLEKENILRHVNYFNSGPSWMPASIYEEEVNKMKVWMRARHSSIIDALSGARLGVKSCAPPTLRVAFKEREGTPSTPHNLRKSISLDSATSDRLKAEFDNRQGWSLVTSAVERYDRAEESCSANTFLIFGAPGSGKSCLVCRLIMDCLESCQNLVPVLLTVADLVKRSESEADISGTNAVSEWFDKYMRLTFGEDSHRYKMLRQAICMHRAVFLIEGLEDGGAHTSVIEQFIRDLVMDRHLVLITSRPLPAGTSSLEGHDEYIVTLELQNLSEEQQRSIAHARLGLDGLNSFDQFFKSLQHSHSNTGGTEEAVFGNPMMLSMLLCYLSMQQQKKEESGKTQSQDAEESVTITEVYRVAVDVMLNRVQSKQQADRHNKQQKIDECMRIVEKMAMKMQIKKDGSMEASEFDKDLPAEMRSTWESLYSAVQADNAVFLRSTTDGTKTDLHFLVRGFQVFFAASEIANNGSEGKRLPGLKALLTDPWWASMLDMLAEAWAHRYKSFIEHLLEKFEPENGNTWLHIAAKEGHRPAFERFKLFSEAHQAALFMPNSLNQMPLHLAAAEGNLQICSLMIQNQAPCDAEDKGELLPMHVALQSKHFKTAKFLLDGYMETREHAPLEKPRRSALLLKSPAEALASQILDESTQFTESDFRKAVADTFAELKFFADSDVPRKQAVGSLLSVYWICRGQYDQFVRPQPEADRLTRESWEKLQDWTKNEVQVTNSPSTLGAMLVFVATMNIGKIKPLRSAFVPDIDEPSEALTIILHKFPTLISSFAKLDVNLQQMILSSLKSSEFNFGQFLQAENLPASLVIVKQILGTQEGASARILNFFLFKIFTSMCGLFSMKTMEGSLFMNNQQYTNYSVGLGVLQHLSHESSQEVYNRFLAERAKSQGLAFNANDKVSRALVRIACLTRVQNEKGGKEILEAFESLDLAERDELTDFLNADGIDYKGFLLYNSPNIMDGGGLKNNAIGLLRAMRMLLKVYRMAAEEYADSEQMVVTIMVQELAQHAAHCNDPEVFEFTKFEIARTAGPKSDCQGSVKLSPWQLMRDKAKLDEIMNAGTDLVSDTMDRVLREPAFLKKLPGVFPEMKFFTFCADDQYAKKAVKQTQGALLAVYWTASMQGEAFARGQAADKKLTERSWKVVTDLHESLTASLLDVVYVVAMVQSLGKIPKFREQLAPKAIGHRQVLAHVMANCPEVLPSYMRLPETERELARFCATVDFSFEQFMTGEALPANLTALQEMFNEARNNENVDDFLQVYLLCSFAELSGSLGFESLEGSLYMTEDMFAKFRCCMEAIQRLWEGARPGLEVAVYKQMLQGNAANLGLPWDDKKPEVVAGVRLACLAQVTNTLDGITMSKIVTEFEDKKQSALLTMYLTADGISSKPGFILSGYPAFLTTAKKNPKVGLKTCAQILLKVYTAAAREFQGSTLPIITISLRKLTACAADFTGSGAFQDMPFELHRLYDTEAMVVPKVWIPVSDKAVLNSMHEQGLEFASDLLQNKVTEEGFKTRILRTYPELSYFSTQASSVRDQTICALLSIYWLLSNQYEAFIRSQPPDDQLTKKSWAWIQEWIQATVKLSSAEAVDAALVFMAIHALGKIPEFREELAPNCSSHMHDVALAQILEDQPQVVPSFSRLSDSYRQLIADSLGVDFQFAQFLQAENTPANLVKIQDRLKPHGDDGFAFFCFRIFVQICGKDASRSLKGSLFMTESQFTRFRPGLVVLQRIMTVGAIQTYQNFLLQRSSHAMARFASPEHQALARLLCLGCAFDPEAGAGICLAFDELQASERATLTKMLNADGVTEQPDYVLSGASDLIYNAKGNKAVTLTDALRMLLAVQRQVLETVGDEQPPSKVVVNLEEVAAWAKRAGPSPDDFLAAGLAVSTFGHAVFAVSVNPSSGAEMVSPISDRTTAQAFNFPPTNGHAASIVSESSTAPLPSSRVKQAWDPTSPSQPASTPPPAQTPSTLTTPNEGISPPQRRGAPPPQVSRTLPASARSAESSTPPVSDSTVTSLTPRTPYVAAPAQTMPQAAAVSTRAAPVVIAPSRSLTPIGRIAGPAVTPPHPGPVGLGIANRQNSFSTSSLISAKATPPLPARIHTPYVYDERERNGVVTTTTTVHRPSATSSASAASITPSVTPITPSITPITPLRTPSQPSLMQPLGPYGSVGPSRLQQRSTGASLVTPVYLSAASTDPLGDPAGPLSPKILLPCPSVVSPERHATSPSGRRTPAPPPRAPFSTPGAMASQPSRMLSRGPACHSTPSLGVHGIYEQGMLHPPVSTRTLSSTASPRAGRARLPTSIQFLPGTGELQQMSALQASGYPISPTHAISPKHARPFR